MVVVSLLAAAKDIPPYRQRTNVGILERPARRRKRRFHACPVSEKTI